MVEHIKYDLFPTAIVRSKCPSITPQDKKEMMDCTDWMIEQKMYTDNELTPKYQTHVILFRDDAPAIWQKLRNRNHLGQPCSQNESAARQKTKVIGRNTWL